MNAIETNHLTRAFGSLVAVDDLTLAIPEGTVFGFLGPNGADKTTTVRLLSALIAPTRGSAAVAGYRLGEHNEAIRQAVGILTETPGLYDRLSAWQNLLFFAALYDLTAERAASQVERYLRLLDLWKRRNDKVGGFSKGMRQKLAIARALLHEPQVIFLDEPTASLDPEAARVVRDFLKELRTEGRTIFLTTHNLPEADELCDLIGVFRSRLLRLGTPANLRSGMFGRGTQVRLVGDATHWIETVRALPFVYDAHAEDGVLSVSLDHPDEQNPALVQAGAQIRAVEPISHSLEQVYLELVENERQAAAVSRYTKKEGASTSMHNVFVILRKEFSEIVQQRVLLFSILLPPLLFAALPLFLLQRIGAGSRASALTIPSLGGLTLHAYTQGVVGTLFSNVYLLLPMLVPSIIAAYSIIGEKNNHTLEPVLATPVRRWHLLTGKILSALLPAVIVTWISGGLFIAELALFTDAILTRWK